ncbi:minor tail protein [Arthrobacter phage Lewando]|nr:minor tail protein [Arthrobacter phage Lewando]
MELHVLDENRRRTEVVDDFTSCIWTERYSGWGDFELVMRSTPGTKSLFRTGKWFVQNQSSRVMEVETLEDKVSQGKSMLSVKGRSIEKIIDDRAATNSTAGTTAAPTWNLSGTPANIARTLFNAVCVTGYPSALEKIPYLETVFTTLQYQRPEPSTVISVELEKQSLYKAIKELCDANGLGFYLVRVGDTDLLRFKVITGYDRTLGQTTFPPVVFSSALGNLADTTELMSVQNFKNVAHIWSKNGAATVYAPGTDPSVSGFQRRVLTIKADDITDAVGATLTQKLNQRGYDELAKARGIFAFDGQTPEKGGYKYQKDYFLGDLVTMQSPNGVQNSMRVAEQTFVCDEQGDKSYPSLTVELTAQPGSWGAEDPTDTWGAATTETWSTS